MVASATGGLRLGETRVTGRQRRRSPPQLAVGGIELLMQLEAGQTRGRARRQGSPYLSLREEFDRACQTIPFTGYGMDLDPLPLQCPQMFPYTGAADPEHTSDDLAGMNTAVGQYA
jgi:hypothetical protein